MNLVPTRALVAADTSSTRSASLLVPLNQALASVAPSTPLERVTVLAAEPQRMVWLRAEYAPAAGSGGVVAEIVPDSSSVVARSSAGARADAGDPASTVTPSSALVPSSAGTSSIAMNVPMRARSFSSRDLTLSYLDAQSSGQRTSRGALLDVLA